MSNGNTDPMPGARELILVVLGGALGYVVVDKLFGGGTRRNPEDEQEGKCPLTEWYGGMPSGGNYSHHTEYEIGAERIAEAAHCILGSLEKGIDRFLSESGRDAGIDDAMSVERAHVVEELQIIEKCIREYSRPLYDQRLLPQNINAEQWVRDEYRQNAIEAAIASVENIKTNSPKLRSLAKRKKHALSYCPDELPSYVTTLARHTYTLIEHLADEMQRSVRYYPDRMLNAFT
jgi:hypothetical protein